MAYITNIVPPPAMPIPAGTRALLTKHGYATAVMDTDDFTPNMLAAFRTVIETLEKRADNSEYVKQLWCVYDQNIRDYTTVQELRAAFVKQYRAMR